MTFGSGKYKKKGDNSWCSRCPKCWANGIRGFSQWIDIKETDEGSIEMCNECKIVILKDNIRKSFMDSKWEVLPYYPISSISEVDKE